MHVDFKATLCTCSKSQENQLGTPRGGVTSLFVGTAFQVNLMTADF